MKKLFFLLLVFHVGISQAQDTAAIHQKAPHVFIDCKTGCDMQYLRTQLDYLNHVRDMRAADVYIMVTTVSNGSGGTQYTLHSVNEKTLHEDTLVFFTPPNVSDAVARETLLKNLKIILLPYVATSLAEFIDYKIVQEKKQESNSQAKDKWNFWTGNINLGGSGGGQSYSTVYNLFSRLGMNRTTNKTKFDIAGLMNYNYQHYNFNGTEVSGYRSNYGVTNFMAFSLGKHFATGYFASFISNSVQNMRGNTTFYPAIECNLFPYDQATRRALRILYRAGVRYQDYYTETIYDTHNLLLFPHSMIIDYIQIEKWGTIDITFGGTHYLNKQSFYNLSIAPTITLNPFKGFKLSLWGNYTFVNDQFYLSKAGASSSQVLLQQAQLKTNFTFFSGINLSYSFGSIYNNVVNVRFDIDRNFWN